MTIPQSPHVPMEDGGHIVVLPNRSVSELHELEESEAFALINLVRQITKGMFPVMEELGHPLYTVNVQDNGNWAFLRGEKKTLHFHIYGRAVDEAHQEYGRALAFHGPESKVWDTYNPLPNLSVLKMLATGGSIESNGFNVSVADDGTVNVLHDPEVTTFDSFDAAIEWANSQGAAFEA